MKKTDPPIVVEQYFMCSVGHLWEALTNPLQMRQWFFEQMPDFQAVKGFATSFAVQSGDRTFTHLWTIEEVREMQKIRYRWQYKEYPGDSFVDFDLFKDDAGRMLLKLTARILDDFPDEIPEFAWESCKGGWDYFIRQRLVDFLNNR